VQIARALVVRPTDDAHRVTTLELFFDLVFVFALTQVTALMAEDPTVRGLGRGLLLLALLWFGWSSYAWLGNQAKADEGLLRAAMLAAMCSRPCSGSVSRSRCGGSTSTWSRWWPSGC
jgi:low temperature requirement protein LtrA